jgi:hypothetical protein
MSQIRVCELHRKLPGAGPGYRCFDHRCLAEAGVAASTRKIEAVEAPSAGVKQVLNARSAGRGPGRVFSEVTGRAAGLRGGTARAQALAPEQRQAIAHRAASVRWGGKTQEAQ